MVDLIQHTATDRRGKRHVFAFDRVYCEIDGERRHVGRVDRCEGAEFMAFVDLTDAEKDAVVDGINAAREKEGKFGPIAGIGAGPSQTVRVREALREIEDEEEYDEDE